MNNFFWKKVEDDLVTKIPNHIKNILYFCGFNDAITVKSIDDEDIEYFEKSARSVKLLRLLDKNASVNRIDMFGVYAPDPENFEFSRGEMKLIKEFALHVKRIVDAGGIINCGTKYFAPETDAEIRNELCTTIKQSKFTSRTHFFLDKLISMANRNINREKGGFRYDDDIKIFASYLRMLVGPLGYETIQKNLECALPSLPSTNRYIRQSHSHATEGILRCDELLIYLNERHLPLVVSLSEDATRIIGRVQYDSSSNQLLGFVLPTCAETGLPIPYSYSARSASDIFEHFTQGNPIASYVNVIMAQPIASTYAPSFCLFIFGSDNKYDSNDVSNRWKFIVKELKNLNIDVLTISSDSDPRYNSAMRKLSLLGSESDLFSNVDWFNCGGLNQVKMFPFYVQDPTHVATKLRNLYLKTIANNKKLPFGKKYFIKYDHLKYLLQHFSKDKHCLTATTLNPVDKQNFGSVERMYDEKVINMLRENVINSQATIKYLEILRNVTESFMNPNLKPLERVFKIWNAVFIIRIWREFVVKSKKLTLKENFLTANCYSCIELNAHSLVQCMIHLKNINMPHLFLVYLFGSQQCEALFRKLRSFTSTYSTVTNSTIKEILGRISKIQLQNDITHEQSQNFTFPRLGDSVNNKQLETIELPAMREIQMEIEKSKKYAIQDAVRIGLIDEKKVLNFDFSCKIKIITNKNKSVKREKKIVALKDFVKDIKPIIPKSILLKNYADKFLNQMVEEHSPYVEVYKDSVKRIVVKKTSLCWLLHKDWIKLSSDRLERVKTATDNERKRRNLRNKFKRKPYKNMYLKSKRI